MLTFLESRVLEPYLKLIAMYKYVVFLDATLWSEILLSTWSSLDLLLLLLNCQAKTLFMSLDLKY